TQVGFVVSLTGEVLAPSLASTGEARQFRLENDKFLSNRESVEVYWNSPKGVVNLNQSSQGKSERSTPVPAPQANAGKSKSQMRNVFPQSQQYAAAPQVDSAVANEQLTSKALAGDAEFRSV